MFGVLKKFSLFSRLQLGRKSRYDPDKKKINEFLSQRNIPTEGLTREQARILRKVKRRAYCFDESLSFLLCCCSNRRLGIGNLIGLIPVVGDLFQLLLAANMVKIAEKASPSRNVVIQMYSNVALDALIGLFPIVGFILNCMMYQKFADN